MMLEDSFDQLFSPQEKTQKTALELIEKQIKNSPGEIDIPALVTFAFARPFEPYSEVVYRRMGEMIEEGKYITDHQEREDYLYKLPNLCEQARSLISALPKPPKKLAYRQNQEFIRYICENGQKKVIEKLIEKTRSEDGASLCWQGTRLRELPEELLSFPEIREMEFHSAFLKSFPRVLLKATQLEKLTIYSSKIASLPVEITTLKKLRKLVLKRNILESLPEEIGELSNLQEIDLSRNKLTELPVSMAKLDKLKTVYLKSNPMTSTLQVQKLFAIFYKQAIETITRKVWLHLIFARVNEALALDDINSVISALNTSLSVLQDNALLALEQMSNPGLQKQTLKKGSVICVYGKFDELDGLTEELREHEIEVTTDHCAQCTHILIGKLPGEGLKLEKTVLTQKMLREFLQADEETFFEDAAVDTENARKKLNELLLSEDRRNSLLAFEIIKSLGMSQEFMAPLYYLYRTTSEKEIRLSAKTLLQHNASKEFLQIINKNQNFSSASEIAFSRYLKGLEAIEDFDASFFAMIVFNQSQMGINYLFETGDSEVRSYVLKGVIERYGYLNLRYSHIKELPEEVGQFTDLTKIDLDGNALKSLPESIGNLKKLNCLIVGENKLSKLPESFAKLESLERLYIQLNKLKVFPVELLQLKKLRVLKMYFNNIKSLPEDLSGMASLEELSYGDRKNNKIPDALFTLKSLTELAITADGMECLPDGIVNLENLKELDISCVDLTKFPQQICQLKNLQVLNIDSNKIKTLPQEIVLLTKLKTLNMRSNGLVDFPVNITRLKSLEVLDIMHNKIETYPAELKNLKKLKQLLIGGYGQLKQDIIDQLVPLVPEGCEVK